MHEKASLEEYLDTNSVQATFYVNLPNHNIKVKAYEHLPKLGSFTGKKCPICGAGDIKVNHSKHGRYEFCSKFILGCKYYKLLTSKHLNTI